jgi:hypothetical protein
MTVTKAYLFANGTVISFGKDWKVIPEYQGPDTDIIPKLRRDYPELVIQRASWVDYRNAPPEAAPERRRFRWFPSRRNWMIVFIIAVLGLIVSAAGWA